MLSDDETDSNDFSSRSISSIIQGAKVDRLNFSGYLEVKLNKSQKSSNLSTWYLFFSRGKVVFSGERLISFEYIFDILKKYIPSLRNYESISPEILKNIIDKAKAESDVLMVGLLGELALSNKFLDYQKFTKVLQSYIIADTEKYLFDNVQEAKLFSNQKIDNLRPIVGLEVEELQSVIESRKLQWSKINKIIPSLDCQIQCNQISPQWKKLPPVEKKKINKLVNSGKTLEEIRYKLGEDHLKIAQIFSKLVKQELVVIGTDAQEFSTTDEPSNTEEITKNTLPKIAVIDDSLVLLKQFSSVVKALGYEVECCDNALKAVDFLLDYEPDVIFIDVNMPELSGFQLMKQIRTQAKLSGIPLVILTAEKTMINQQRAKWSKSQFLSKPLSSEDNRRFITELKSMLPTLAPVNK